MNFYLVKLLIFINQILLMNLSNDLLFFFSALGAFNGLLIGAYIVVFKEKKHILSFFLGMSILLLSIRVGQSVLLHFYKDLSEVIIQIGFVAYLFVGPFQYFFVYTVSHPEYVSPKWKYHVLALVPFIAVPIIFYPYYEYQNTVWNILVRAISLVWLFYIILSISSLIKCFKRNGKETLNKNPFIKLTISLVIGFSLVWLIYKTCGYISFDAGALTFTFITYFLAVLIFNTNWKRAFMVFNKKSYSNENARKLLERLDLLFHSEKLYKQSSLKCGDVAAVLDVPSYYLSQVINDFSNMNFNNFVNQYRVEAAKKMLLTNNTLTIEAIGQECGFKSKSSFYAAFKKNTETTPSKYVQN